MSEAIQLAILGATGSIGRQALEVVRAHPERLRVVALGANRNAEALRDLAAEFPSARTALGANALAALATDSEAELVLVATPGVAALRATIAALSEGKRVALANKEVLVAAGHLIRRLVGGAGGRLPPGDSEHNGPLQGLVRGRRPRGPRAGRPPAGGGPPPAPPRGPPRAPPPQPPPH